MDEFFNMLMDRIENLIKGKREDKVIRNLFQGVFANEFICKGCPHYSENGLDLRNLLMHFCLHEYVIKKIEV